MLPAQWTAITETIVPQSTIAITLAADPGDCLLRLLAPFDHSDKWPASPHSIIGNAVHSLLHRFSNENKEQRQKLYSNRPALEIIFLREVFNRSDFKEEKEFGNWFKNIPSEFWEGALQTLSSGISQISDNPIKPYLPGKEPTPNDHSSEFGKPFEQINFQSKGAWSEIPIESIELGVKGRCDLIVSDGTGKIRVDDFKAGSLNGDTEKIRLYSRQVLIYLCILHLKHPESSLSGRLIAADGILPVPIVQPAIDSLTNELRTAKATWPTATIKSEGISKLGHKCSICRLRHRCPAYRDSKPWSQAPSSPFPVDSWTQDVWGTAIKVHKGPYFDSVALRTSTGSRIIINGIDHRRQIGKLALNQEVGFFGLIRGRGWRPESQEFVEHHPNGRRAWSLKIFVEQIPA